MNAITKILLYFITTSVVLILMLSISELTGKKPANTTINERYEIHIPDNCAKVFRYRRSIHKFYSVICYEPTGIKEPPVFNPDSSYIARVQAVKDSLRNEFEGW